MAALQLIAGARAFFAGEVLRTEEILADANSADARLAAQAQLFLSAARFALYRMGGERDDGLLGDAAAGVHRCHSLDPDLAPSPRVFSPAFRDFFTSASSR